MKFPWLPIPRFVPLDVEEAFKVASRPLRKLDLADVRRVDVTPVPPLRRTFAPYEFRMPRWTR